ncbi:Lar family restriction alleviation protein [Yersinia enterocolitica]
MSENTDEKLKPCPFCGGKAHLLTSNGSFLVECSVCLTDFLNGPVGIGWYRSEKDAAADWNDRPSERALIAQLEAAQKELFDFHNQEFQQRLANAEHQLYMKDLAIHNIKASRKAQFRKRLAAEAELSAANEKLSKPVVLPDYRCSPDMHTKQYYETIGFNLGLDACKAAIKAAGFTVEGE